MSGGKRRSGARTARPSLLVTRRLPEAVEAALRERFAVTQSEDDVALTSEQLVAGMLTHDALLCTVTDHVGPECFAVPGRRARIVANFGVGVNHIAVDAARAAGVVITNTPDVLTDDTADLTIALMLAVMRRMGEGERQVRSGAWTGWRPTHLLGHRLHGKTLGVIGLGRIGRAVARRAALGFGMNVLGWSRSRRRPSEAGAPIERVTRLDHLLERCDVVSIHCPLVPTTRHLIGAMQFGRMRPTAFLINTARGPIVDEAALVTALEEGRIAGAGLDVYEDEPRVHPGLIGREDVVLLPHLGSATRETRDAMGMRAVENLDAFFAGNEPPDRVP
jgi:lactate dehydrogenase-like 2-hydroxyacid dehydrogenase